MNLRTNTSFAVTLMFLGTVFPGGESRRAQASDAEADHQYVRAINGFLEGRQKLKRGMARLTGKYAYVIESNNQKRITDIHGLYVFDFPERLLRVDAQFKTTDEAGIEQKGLIEGYQFADLENKSVLKHPNNAVPRRLINVGRELPDYVTRFDIRVLGAAHAVGWDRITLKELAENFDHMQDGVTAVQKEDERIRVTLIAKRDGQPSFRRVIWFREDHDDCPEKLEVSLPKRIVGQPPVNDQVEWDAPSQTQQMEVIKFQDQWVPKKVIIENGTDKRELEFQWLTLNEPLNPKAFDFDFDFNPKE